MPRATASTNVIATIGIDISKNALHVIGLDGKGAITLRQKLSRGQISARLRQYSAALNRHGGVVGRITWVDNSVRLATTRG
jgi:hypothetical protein